MIDLPRAFIYHLPSHHFLQRQVKRTTHLHNLTIYRLNNDIHIYSSTQTQIRRTQNRRPAPLLQQQPTALRQIIHSILFTPRPRKKEELLLPATQPPQNRTAHRGRPARILVRMPPRSQGLFHLSPAHRQSHPKLSSAAHKADHMGACRLFLRAFTMATSICSIARGEDTPDCPTDQ